MLLAFLDDELVAMFEVLVIQNANWETFPSSMRGSLFGRGGYWRFFQQVPAGSVLVTGNFGVLENHCPVLKKQLEIFPVFKKLESQAAHKKKKCWTEKLTYRFYSEQQRREGENIKGVTKCY